MKALKLTSLLAAVVLLAASCGGKKETVQADDAQEVQESTGTELMVDATGSEIMWVGYKGLGSAINYSHQGTIDVTAGSLTVSDGNLTGGNFDFDLKTIVCTDEGLEDEKKASLTGHLLNSDFFGVYETDEDNNIIATHEENAKVSFVITGASAFNGTASEDEWSTSNPTHNVTGNLTIKGITKSITFPAHVVISEGSVSASAKFYINRQEWGMSFMAGDADLIDQGKEEFIKDEMGIGLNITAKAAMAGR